MESAARRPPSPRWTEQDHLWCLMLTVLFEGLTAWLRFGWSLQSTRDTGFLRTLTLGLRIHHGYLGFFIVLLGWLWWQRHPRTARWLRRVGVALILSDLIHHFMVLWPITGSPQFDLFYP